MSFFDRNKKKTESAGVSGELVKDAKHCPFCGQSEIVISYVKAQKLHYVGCLPCRAFIVTESRNVSIGSWNSRFVGLPNP
jgi:transcription elongation factor Elf1